jgi:hypothetical protein
MMRTLLLLTTLLVLGACADREWYKDGMNYDQRTLDHAECDYEASKITGYDGIDSAIRRGEVMRKCMHMKGYTQRTRSFD